MSCRPVAVALVAAGLIGFVLYIRHRSGLPMSGAPAPAVTTAVEAEPGLEQLAWTFTSNQQCQQCHPEIFEEWLADEHSQAWHNQPLFPQDPKRTECVSCHASVPILENGLEQEIRVRATRFEEGIGCIECHKSGDTVRGPLASSVAPCNPRRDPVFLESKVCMPCHAPHGTFDEWRGSRFQDTTCQECHMAEVAAVSRDGTPRKRRSHVFLSMRHEAMRNQAVTVQARQEGQAVRVQITNDKTGHAFPGEISNRLAILRTRFLDAGGAGIVVGTDAAGEARAGHEHLMRAVPRPQRTEKSRGTQLGPGETRSFSYPLPAGAAKVLVELKYKFQSLFAEISVWEAEFEVRR